MNYGQLSRAVETVIDLDYHSKVIDEETKVKVFVDGTCKDIVAIYPEEMDDGSLVLVIEVGR